jgi:hypothetical protein
MASILKVDDLRGNTAAGNITVTGEGGSGTMQLQQGLCKHWITFDGTGTVSVTDSLNNASLTDRATGSYAVGYTNNMNNANSSLSGGAKKNDSTDDGNQHVQVGGDSGYTNLASETRIMVRRNIGTGEAIDTNTVYLQCVGDLA